MVTGRGLDYRVRFPMGQELISSSRVKTNYGAQPFSYRVSVGEILPGYETELTSIQTCVAMYIRSYIFMTELNWAFKAQLILYECSVIAGLLKW
jgi:hypothetical protein